MGGIINIAITESVLISGWIGFPEELNRFMQIIMNGKQSLCMGLMSITRCIQRL